MIDQNLPLTAWLNHIPSSSCAKYIHIFYQWSSSIINIFALFLFIHIFINLSSSQVYSRDIEKSVINITVCFCSIFEAMKYSYALWKHIILLDILFYKLNHLKSKLSSNSWNFFSSLKFCGNNKGLKILSLNNLLKDKYLYKWSQILWIRSWWNKSCDTYSGF